MITQTQTPRVVVRDRKPNDASIRRLLGAARVFGMVFTGCLMAAGLARGAGYFVDGSGGTCSSSGPGTPAQPYCTISAALAAHAHPGDTIYVKPGIYRETVTVPGSGAAGNPLVIQALGGPVVIDGADDFASASKWTAYSGDVWLASSVTWSPVQVFADGVRLTASTASPASLPPRTFRWVSGQGLYVNVGGGSPGLHQAVVGHRASAFLLSGKAWVLIDGFTITRTEGKAIYASGSSSDLTFSRIAESFAGKYGIQANACARLTIASCATMDNADHGIALTGGTTGCVIQDNESARNALPTAREANGIYLYAAPANFLLRNRWHHNQDTGEQIQSGSDDNISINNASWSNGDHGFDHLLASRSHHVGDVAYGNYKDGFSIEGNSPGHTIVNCIAVNNGLTTNEFDLWVDSASSSGFVSDDNLFWNSTSQKPVKFISTTYASVAAYSAASGRDTRTVQADPRFVDAANGNFHLQAASPAIDNANSSVESWPTTDAAGNARVDDPATPNTGLGAVAYADRGAFEYVVNGLPPVAALTAQPSSGAAPLAVTLDAGGSSDPDGVIMTYAFAFGDGTTSGPQASPTALHTYAGGTWWATVTVTDNSGLTSNATVSVTATAPPNQPPTAALQLTPTTGLSPLPVNADAGASSDLDGSVVAYAFDFGDGTIVGPQPGATASHTYVAGTWTATVTVTDDLGATGRASQTLTVTAPVTTNLCGNPSFESSTNGWTSYTNARLQRIAGGHAGSWSLQMTARNSSSTFGTDDSPNWIAATPAAPTRYRFTAWVRSEAGRGSSYLQVRERYAGQTIGSTLRSATVTLSPTWQPISLDFVTARAGSSLDLRILDTPFTNSEAFQVDDVSIIIPGPQPNHQPLEAVSMADAADATSEGDKPLAFSVSLAPNPAIREATLSFVTTRAGAVAAQIFDLSGRSVRRLMNESSVPAGIHRLRIDARDDGARALDPGVYFYHLQTAERTVVGRFVIMR